MTRLHLSNSFVDLGIFLFSCCLCISDSFVVNDSLTIKLRLSRQIKVSQRLSGCTEEAVIPCCYVGSEQTTAVLTISKNQY